MLAATGKFRLLSDADLSVPIAHVERLLPPQSGGVDIAVGSREAPGAARYGEPGRRHLMGRVFNSITRSLAAPWHCRYPVWFQVLHGGIRCPAVRAIDNERLLL